MRLPGFWSDVVALPGDRVALVTGGAYDIFGYDEAGTRLWTQPTPQGMWYLRAAALPDGTIGMVGQGHQGGGTQIAIRYPDGTTTHAQYAQPFMWAQSIIRSIGSDVWELCIQTSPTTWQRVVLGRDGAWTPGPVEAVPVWPGGDGGTSGGFAYFTDQGVPVWNDPNYVRAVGGVTLLRSHETGGLAVGQDPAAPGLLVVVGATIGRLHPDADAYEPHAVSAGGRWAVCARSVNGLALFDVLEAPFTMLEPWLPSVPAAPAHLRMCGYFYRDTAVHPYIAKWGGENPSAPGTHSVIVDDHGLPAEPHPGGSTPRMIVGLAQLLHPQMPSWWDRVDAVYVAVENDPATLRDLVGLAGYLMARRHLALKPVLTYSAGTLHPSAIGPTDLLGVQLYAERGADPVQSIRDQAAAYGPQIQHVPRVVIVAQSYDRGGWFTGPQIAAIQPVIYDVACAWPNCEGIAWFSDARAGGTRDYEQDVRPWHTAIWEQIRRNA